MAQVNAFLCIVIALVVIGAAFISWYDTLPRPCVLQPDTADKASPPLERPSSPDHPPSIIPSTTV